jgi:hypothetical protein
VICPTAKCADSGGSSRSITASGTLARTREFDAAVVRAGVHEREIDPEAFEPPSPDRRWRRRRWHGPLKDAAICPEGRRDDGKPRR